MLIDYILEAQVHRDVYSSILSGLIPWGMRGDFANRIDLSRTSLARFLNPIDITREDKAYLISLLRHNDHSPSRETAERISRMAPLPREQQIELAEHMNLAWGYENDLLRNIRPSKKRSKYARDDKLSGEAMGELLRAYRLAIFSHSPVEAKTYFAACRHLAQILLVEFLDARLGLEAAQTHILLSDLECVFNRPVQGLYHALMARRILDKIHNSTGERWEEIKLKVRPDAPDYVDLWNDEGWVDGLTIDAGYLYTNTYRAQAVCLEHLNLFHEAANILEAASHTEGALSFPKKWQMHISNSLVAAMSVDPTVGLFNLKDEADKGREVYDGDQIGFLLLQAALAKGYILRERMEDAKKILSSNLRDTDQLRGLYQQHKTMLLTRVADLYYEIGENDEWLHFVTKATELAHTGNFVDKKKELLQKYGKINNYAQVYEKITGELSTT